MVILEVVKSLNDKIATVFVSFIKPKARKREGGGEAYSEVDNGGFREKVSDFSLDLRQIQPSSVFGTRRKATLRGEGFAWVPDLRSLDKLLEVGVSPYLGFIHSLSTLSMFELNKVVRGRLIGPKTWDRIVGNFFRIFLLSVTV